MPARPKCDLLPGLGAKNTAGTVGGGSVRACEGKLSGLD